MSTKISLDKCSDRMDYDRTEGDHFGLMAHARTCAYHDGVFAANYRRMDGDLDHLYVWLATVPTILYVKTV